MKISDLLEAIETEKQARIESRNREENHMIELAKKNPFKCATIETDDDGIKFNVHYAVMGSVCFSAQGYDKNGKYREKHINFCDVEE